MNIKNEVLTAYDESRIQRFADALSLLPDGNLMKSDGAYLIRKLKNLKNILSTTKEACICTEWDGKGKSVCGFDCPVHTTKEPSTARIIEKSAKMTKRLIEKDYGRPIPTTKEEGA